MKRVIAFVMALMMVIPLAGCGNGKASIDEEKLNDLFTCTEDEFTGIKVFTRGEVGYGSSYGGGYVYEYYGSGNDKRMVPYKDDLADGISWDEDFNVSGYIIYEKNASVPYTFNLTIYNFYPSYDGGSELWISSAAGEIQILMGDKKYDIKYIKCTETLPSIHSVNFVALGMTGGEMLKEICAYKGELKIRTISIFGETRDQIIDPSAFKEALDVWNDYESIGGTTQDLSVYNKNVIAGQK
ncbi:MAG: hypothetical protein IJU18_05320 [Oscillospiraceae bacterium]|nr:hypothetical protein [Oscillospiraceae bacterium]